MIVAFAVIAKRFSTGIMSRYSLDLAHATCNVHLMGAVVAGDDASAKRTAVEDSLAAIQAEREAHAQLSAYAEQLRGRHEALQQQLSAAVAQVHCPRQPSQDASLSIPRKRYSLKCCRGIAFNHLKNVVGMVGLSEATTCNKLGCTLTGYI